MINQSSLPNIYGQQLTVSFSIWRIIIWAFHAMFRNVLPNIWSTAENVNFAIWLYDRPYEGRRTGHPRLYSIRLWQDYKPPFKPFQLKQSRLRARNLKLFLTSCSTFHISFQWSVFSFTDILYLQFKVGSLSIEVLYLFYRFLYWV